MADLKALKAEVDTHAASIVSLKSASAAPADIKAAVSLLLSAKKAYAESNNGIGVDGKPFDDGKKKKKEKSDKPLEKIVPNEENSKKKADKKAAKAAAKQAHKDGNAPPPCPCRCFCFCFCFCPHPNPNSNSKSQSDSQSDSQSGKEAPHPTPTRKDPSFPTGILSQCVHRLPSPLCDPRARLSFGRGP